MKEEDKETQEVEDKQDMKATSEEEPDHRDQGGKGETSGNRHQAKGQGARFDSRASGMPGRKSTSGVWMIQTAPMILPLLFNSLVTL